MIKVKKAMDSRIRFLIMGLLMMPLMLAAQNPLVERVTYSYPMSMPYEEQDIEWQRIVYRELSKSNGLNAGLFYKTGGECLFTHIFNMVMSGKVKAYNYGINGNLTFSEDNIMNVKTLLKNFHIAYTENAGIISIDKTDIPSSEIKAYYIEESNYYDIRNSSFHTRCLAICPILFQEDEFDGVRETKYPMFWVNYMEIEPYLRNVLVFGDSYNTASMMPVCEFFAARLYKGDIYKVVDMRDMALPEYCKSDSTLGVERSRIEKELTDVRKNVYNIEVKYPAPPVAAPAKRKSHMKKLKNLFRKK